jgi:hypothetical protein
LTLKVAIFMDGTNHSLLSRAKFTVN